LPTTLRGYCPGGLEVKRLVADADVPEF
jgi:hypothetical protein